MSPLALGPVLMLLGLVAAYFTLRTRARVKKSMYRKLRDQRERQIKIARQRAHDAKVHAEQAERDRLAAERAAADAAYQAAQARTVAANEQKNVAPAATASAEPVATAKVEELHAPPSLVWDEAAAPPAAADPVPAPPEPVMQPAPEPVWEPTAPITAKPEPKPEPVTEPEPVAAAPQPEPEPELDAQLKAETAGGAGWEIVESIKPDQKPAAGVASDAHGDRAAWELPTADTVDPQKGRRERQPALPGEIGESPLQVVMSYAGLVAALLVIMLGILFMVGARG